MGTCKFDRYGLESWAKKEEEDEGSFSFEHSDSYRVCLFMNKRG